jgi:hypothetical protein
MPGEAEPVHHRLAVWRWNRLAVVQVGWQRGYPFEGIENIRARLRVGPHDRAGGGRDPGATENVRHRPVCLRHGGRHACSPDQRCQ